MGAGQYAAGAEPGGLDPVAPPSALAILPDQGAPIYFLQSKGFVQKDDGTFFTADYVDQAAQLAMGVGTGTIASAPDVGNRLRKLGRLSPQTRDATVTDAVEDAWADLIAAGLLRIHSVAVEEPSRGQLIVVASYFNLLRTTDKPDTVRAPVT